MACFHSNGTGDQVLMINKNMQIKLVAFLVLVLCVLFMQVQPGIGAEETKGPADEKKQTQPVSKKLRLPFHMGQDKYQHLTLSAFLVAGQMFLLQEQGKFSQNRAMRVSIAATALLGIVKEGYDFTSKKGHASLRDMAANAVGICVGIILFSINQE